MVRNEAVSKSDAPTNAMIHPIFLIFFINSMHSSLRFFKPSPLQNHKATHNYVQVLPALK
jgi:hypothetical protein